MRSVPVLAALMIGPTLLSAQGAGISASEPQTIVDAISSFGHKARLETDSRGDPMIRARMDGINYAVFFYGCENGSNCLDIQLMASFDMEAPLTAEFANTYNRDWVAGKLFLDEEGDPSLAFMVVGTGGITEAHFHDVLRVWEGAVDRATEEIGW